MVGHRTKQLIEMTFAFYLLAIVAGFLGVLLKPSITGAVTLNNELSKSSSETIGIYLLIALVFFVLYALYLNINKKRK